MGGIEKMVALVVGAVVLLLITGYLIVNLWPTITVVSGNITAMGGTDAGKFSIKSLWPVLIIIVAIVVIVALIFWAIKQLRD